MNIMINLFRKVNIYKYFIYDAIFLFIYTIIIYLTSSSVDSVKIGYSFIIFYLFYIFFNGFISKTIELLIKEYNFQGYYKSKDRVISLSKKLLIKFSVICFIMMMFLGLLISKIINFDIIKFVFINGITLFLLPFICVYRSHLSAYKLDKIVRNSYLINYSVVIICGILDELNYFKLEINYSLVISFLISLIYLFITVSKNKKVLCKKTLKVKENIITDIEIKNVIKENTLFNTIVEFFIVFIYLIDVLILNVLLISKNYSISDIYSIIGVVLFFGLGINILLLVFIIGFFNKFDNSKIMINKKLPQLLLVVAPITVLLSFLARPIWTLLYSNNLLEISVYRYSSINMIFIALFIWCLLFLYRLKEKKMIYYSLLICLICNLVLKLPLTYGFNSMGFSIYYGSITSLMLSFFITSWMILRYIGKKTSISYENIINKILNIFLIIISFIIVLLFTNVLLPFNSNSRFISFIYLVLVGLVGLFIYTFIIMKSRIFNNKISVNKVKKGK